MSTKKSIFFSVGEPSGDLHAAKLIDQMLKRQPNLSIRGFGGGHMSAAGMSIDYDLTQLAVVGFVEVVPKLREFFRVADQASAIFDSERPDAVVLVDFPGFNWHIAKRAKERGIPCYYYLPPQLWAWGSWRVNKLRRTVDHVYCNLPFEEAWFREQNVSCEYVGHPFFDEVAQKQLDTSFIKDQTNQAGSIVAVLPGSRRREIATIWPMQLQIMGELARRHATPRFLVACLNEHYRTLCQVELAKSKYSTFRDRVSLHVNKTSEIIEVADCSLMKSGSVSLEMMARGTPSVVVYHVGRMLYAATKLLTNLKSMTLPNLIAEKTIMPEFLAVGSTGKAVEQSLAAVDRLLSLPDERERQRAELLALTQKIAKRGASSRVARSLLERIYLASTVAKPPSQQSTVSDAA